MTWLCKSHAARVEGGFGARDCRVGLGERALFRADGTSVLRVDCDLTAEGRRDCRTGAAVVGRELALECKDEYSSSESSFADFRCRCFKSSACASACAFFVASEASSLRSLPSDPSASRGCRNSDRISCGAGLGAGGTTGVAGAAAVGNAITLMESPGPNSGDSGARRR